MNDDQIREFFHSNRPVTGDEGTYLAGLSAKLEAVESVKRLQEQSIRRYKRIMRWTLVGSVILSAAITVLFISHPELLQSPTILRQGAASFVGEWKPAIIAAIAAIALVLGLIPWEKTYRVS